MDAALYLLAALSLAVFLTGAALLARGAVLQGLLGIGALLATIAALAMCVGGFAARPGVDRGATLRALDALTGASAQLQREPPGGERR